MENAWGYWQAGVWSGAFDSLDTSEQVLKGVCKTMFQVEILNTLSPQPEPLALAWGTVSWHGQLCTACLSPGMQVP